MPKFELIGYDQEPSHAVEITVTRAEIGEEKERRYSGPTVARIKLFDEETGKYSWFAIDAEINNGRPAVRVTAIKDVKDKIIQCVGKWREPRDC